MSSGQGKSFVRSPVFFSARISRTLDRIDSDNAIVDVVTGW
jgi:hypothetical protein